MEEPPQTLAAGELVWAKTKGRPHWWPARLPAASKDAPVTFFDSSPSSTATSLRRFADPAADKMARACAAPGFHAALELAHAHAVAILCAALTCACACASPPPPAASPDDTPVVVGGLDNLTPPEFLASLRRAALDAPAIGLVDRARLKSWARALAQGWGPAGPGRYTRRSLEELVDKIDLDDDLNEPSGDAGADEEEDPDKVLEKTPGPSRRRKGRPRKDASRKEDADDDDQKEEEEENGDQKEEDESGAETALSTGRKRKKSKYLSWPYTDLSSSVLDEKLAVSPKESQQHSSGAAAKEEKKVLRDNVDVGEVLELVHSIGEGFFQGSEFPKAVERFLGLLRSSTFSGVDVASLASDSVAALKLGKSVLERSRRKDEGGVGGSSAKRKKKTGKTSPTATLDFPAENVVAEDTADAAGLASDSGAALKKEKGVRKRSAKKDQDGSGGSSIKRKKVEKTSPKKTTLALPAENVLASTSVEGTGLVPHSFATAEQGKGVTKRGRKKKDQDGSGGSSIKRKRMKKTSPTAFLDSGMVITPAIPIRQVRAEDILISQVRSGAGAGIGVGILDQNKLVFKSPISSAMFGGIKMGEEQDQGDGASVMKTPVTVEATMPETDKNVESAVADLPAKSVQAEETKHGMGIQVDMNVQSGIIDVPIRSVQMETMELEANVPVHTNEQGVVTDLPVRSGLLPKDGGISQPADGSTAEVCAVQGVAVDLPFISGFLPDKHGGISEPADGNTDATNVEVRTVQESYACLEAMVPEMYKKENEIATGTNDNAMGHAFKAEGQKKTAGEAIANHAPAVSTNGTCSDPHNSTPKRRNKKAPQYFANPAEILLDFTDGVILPSKEELLSAFSKFGILIESASDILGDIRGARVVFGRSADADAVYSKGGTPGIFGQFGPPFATLKRLNYLPPFTPSIPLPPATLKPPLGVADMRKNVENMMLSLAGKQAAATSSSTGTKPAPEYLLGEMQQLLSKLHNIQAGPSFSSGSAPP